MTLNDLADKVKGFISNPIGNIQQGITNWATQNPQPARQIVNLQQSIPSYPQQVQQNFQRMNPITQVAAPYVQNRVVNPLLQGIKDIGGAWSPEAIKQPLNPMRAVDLGKGLLNIGQAAFNLTPGGLPFAAYDYAKSAMAAKQQGQSIPQIVQAGKQGFTGEKTVGLGQAVTNNQKAQQFLNIAELPLMLAVTHQMGGKERVLSTSKETVVKARELLGQQLGALEGDVTKKYTSGQIDTAVNKLAGTDINTAKDAFHETAIKLSNFIQAAEKGLLVNKPIVGLSTRAVREEKKGAQLPKGDISKAGGEIGKGGVNKGATVNMGEQMGQKVPLQENLTTPKVVSQSQDIPQQPIGGGVPPSNPNMPSSPPIIPPNTNDPVQVIINALKEAKPLEQKQGGIYAKIRSQQAGAVAGVGKSVPGEAGYFAQLGQLKGEMPKVSFESVRKQVTQPNIDALFNQVEQSNLTPFEKVTAKSGLAKLLGAEGGSVPVQGELQLLNQVFPPEFIQTVLDKRPLMQKLFALGTEALNLPRAMMATADLSAPLRQGAFLIGRPKTWIPAFVDMFKYAASDKAYQGLKADIQSRPTYQLMRENKLAITDMSPILQNREEAFMSNLSEKIPGFGKLAAASNRAYSGFLNKLRADTFDSLVKGASEQGLDVKTIAPDIAKFVNSATGRGDLGSTINKASAVLNGAFFSPRLMQSRLNLLNPLYYAKLDPFVRKEALKSLLTFAGTGLTVLGLAKLGGATVNTDPRNADFGKIKVGDTRYDTWAGFQQYFVIAARLLTGQMVSSTTGKEIQLGEGYKPTTRFDIIQRFFESKESPIASFATALLKGQTSMGEKLNIPVEVIDRFIPMVAQDMYDLYRQDGSNGIFKAIPGIFGVGVQTYTDQIPMQGTTPTGKVNVQWRQAPGLGENILNTITGTKISNVPPEQWQGLRDIKQMKSMQQIEKDKIKKQVLETGQSQTINGTNIFLKNGVVTEQQPGQDQPNIFQRIMGVKPAGAAETTPPSVQPYLDKMKAKYTIDNAKQQVQMNNQPQTVGTNYIYLNDKGNPVVIDTSFQPTKPTLTGNTELDKKAISAYTGEITQKANDIYALFKQGQLSADQANTQLAQLKDLKATFAKPKKPKAIKIAKPKKVKAIKIKMPKVSKMKPIKLKQIKIKTTKYKPIKLTKK